VKAAFPNYLRLSIHQSTGEHKVSMSLLDTKTGFTTPWHCSVALMADGGWLSAPMGEFKKDPKLEVIYEDGKPSYFKERVIEVKQPVEILEEELKYPSSTQASSCAEESGEEKITGLARTLSRATTHGVKNEKGELINPFFGSENPLLDPNSGKFSSKAWLETLMSIESRDPERYPKRVAGVAYKSLSAYGFGEPTDYQKTFGNYPLGLLSLTKRLIGKGKKSRIQILRDFDGLIKSGEMLVVLGRPGRQVALLRTRMCFC